MDIFPDPGDTPLWHYLQSEEALLRKKKEAFHAFVDRARKGIWWSGSGG